MPEFFNVLAPDAALRLLLQRMELRVAKELVATGQALGRVLFEDIRSPEDLPAFPRSTMDGYSVRASDTYGATEGLPAYLDMAGEVEMGRAAEITLALGQAAVAYTGGMLARGADAVVMVEHTQQADDTTIEVMRAVAPGENMVQPGEDVKRGETVLVAGHILRPQDVGGLLALGITEIAVGSRPRVTIVSTGDELVPPEQQPGHGQVRDINSYSVSALVQRYGGVPISFDVVADDFDAQRQAAHKALEQGDIVVFSAGSSVSSRDLTAGVLAELGPPGVIVHGISLKPGKPTVIALADGKPAFGLPGNPVSAMVVFDLLVRPVIYALSGRAEPPPLPAVRARLSRDIASVSGREDHVEVRLEGGDDDLRAEPIFGKSNLIYTLVNADGRVVVPLDRGGLYADEMVTVTLY